MFKVECLGCQAPYQVDERRVPEKGLKMRCPKCGTTFKVEPPAAGDLATGQSPATETDVPPASVPKPHPFSSGPFEPSPKLAKPSASRDSLARTMIGVSSVEMESLGKDKPKGFRIPRPNEGKGEAAPAPAAAPAAANPAIPFGEIGLPAPVTPFGEIGLPAPVVRSRPLGLAARTGNDDAGLPAVVNEPRRGQPAAEVQVVLPSAAPAPDPAWLSGDELAEVPPSMPGEQTPMRFSDLPQPVVARAATPKVEAPVKVNTLELDLDEDLPIIAPPVKRPPPRRPRPAQAATEGSAADESVDLPARVGDFDAGLPAVVAPPARPLDRAPRPPARQKAASPEEVDLPAVAPRDALEAGLPFVRGPAVAKPPAAKPGPREAPTLAELPSVTRARAAEQKGLSDGDLPAIGGGQPGAGKARAPTRADLPGAGRRAPMHSDLPGVLGGGAPATSTSDLPGVFGGSPASTSDLPGVFGGSPASTSDLPGVFGGGGAGSGIGLPEMVETGLPDLSGGSLPGLSTGRAELPEVFAGGLPEVSGSALPELSYSGLPMVHDGGLPDVLASGLPEVSSAGLPDVLAAGLPTVSAGLPEVFAPGVGGFGRVDLPVPRAAELPEVHAGQRAFDELDLPGVGESLPSVAEGWNEGNLPTVGESLPMPKGEAFGGDSPFGAFDPAGEGDPFAGSEADFGAPGEGDPFAPANDPTDGLDEFAPLAGGAAARAGGAGYGEVDIGGPESTQAPIETAEDMEFQAIPQRPSAAAGRAAASASVHVEAPDTDATGSTLELGPERKAPKARRRRIATLAAIGLATIAGGAMALEPALGPFGIHFVVDQIKRGEREQTLARLVGEARTGAGQDTLDAWTPVLRELEKARELAPRFAPLIARSAFEHYAAVTRHGPLPALEAIAKVAVEQLDPESQEPESRLARAAQKVASGSAQARGELEALGNDPDAQALLGELSLRAGDWAGARNVWGELSRRDPESARYAFGNARAELGLGRAAEAFAEASRVLKLNPKHVGAPILMLEARRAGQQGSDPGALDGVSTAELAARVSSLLPDASPGEAALGHCVLGELHESQGRAGPAQQEFEAALVIDRGLPRALLGLGEVLHDSGRYGEALARFQSAAQADPTLLAAQIGIAKCEIQLAHLKEARDILGKLGETHKEDPEVIFWQAKAEQALGDTDAALATYRAAITAGKGRASSVNAYLSLAKLQAELGQLALAQDTLSEASQKLPPNGALHKALGEIALSRADSAVAFAQFQKALELDPGDTRARFLGAVALTRLGRFDEALLAFQTVGQTDKDFPGLAVERGRLFEESGRSAEALSEYEAALLKTPDDPEVQIRVGCARVATGQALAAESLLEKTSKVRPRSAELNFCLGRALFDLERHQDATVRLDRAIAIDPSRAIYHLYSGWVASEMGRSTNAQKSLDDAIELDKGLADAYWQRGRLHLKQGAAKDAIVDLERARALKPSRYDALADLAVAYADSGRLSKALELWEEAIARDADNPTWHFRYGRLLSSSGNGPMAAAHLRRAIDLVKEAEAAATGPDKPKPPVWLWQANYLLGRELGKVPAAIPHWQAYLRLAPRDDPYRAEAERSLRELGQPWSQR
jgi:cellulose synthase operon protein C